MFYWFAMLSPQDHLVSDIVPNPPKRALTQQRENLNKWAVTASKTWHFPYQVGNNNHNNHIRVQGKLLLISHISLPDLNLHAFSARSYVWEV